MATNNAINITPPLTVADGGTGLTTITDHAVLVGSGASAVTPITVGATGELLLGVTGADPAFGTSSNGDFTFTATSSGILRTLGVRHTVNAANSRARVALSVAGGSSGDPYIDLVITGTTQWLFGIDNSTADTLKMTPGAALGTGDVWTMTTAGERNLPLQPAFLAYLASTDADVTGNATAFQLGSTTALTEVFDQGSDFNTNGTFTAPVTGRYVLSGCVYLGTVGTASGAVLSIITDNRTYTSSDISPTAGVNVGTSEIGLHISVVADMDATDTATLSVVSTGAGGDTVDVIGGSPLKSYFSGYLAV